MSAAQELFNQASSKFQSGDLFGAFSDWSDAMLLNPGLLDSYLRWGRALGEVFGDYEGAIQACTNAIQIDPDCADAYYYRGKARWQLQDERRAIADFNEAIRLNSDNTDAYRCRFLIRLGIANYQAALEDLTELIRLEPNSAAHYYYQRGTFRSYLGDNRGAAEDFSELIGLEATARNYYNRGAVRYLLGNNEEAIADFDKVLELNPKFIAAYYHRSNARYNLEDEEGAIADYSEARRLDEEDGEVDSQDEHEWYARGIALARQQDNDGATHAFQQAAQICRQNRNMAFYQEIMNEINRLDS